MTHVGDRDMPAGAHSNVKLVGIYDVVVKLKCAPSDLVASSLTFSNVGVVFCLVPIEGKRKTLLFPILHWCGDGIQRTSNRNRRVAAMRWALTHVDDGDMPAGAHANAVLLVKNI